MRWTVEGPVVPHLHARVPQKEGEWSRWPTLQCRRGHEEIQSCMTVDGIVRISDANCQIIKGRHQQFYHQLSRKWPKPRSEMEWTDVAWNPASQKSTVSHRKLASPSKSPLNSFFKADEKKNQILLQSFSVCLRRHSRKASIVPYHILV